jgi:Flp pilus assembly pilin Flp
MSARSIPVTGTGRSTERPAKSVMGYGFVYQFIRDDSGQNVVEYGLLIATIAIVIVLATAAFGQSIGTWFNSLSGQITTIGIGSPDPGFGRGRPGSP